MRSAIFFLGFVLALPGLRAAERLPIERQVEAATQSAQLTVVHFWAPWCANCRQELKDSAGWGTFIARHPQVNFIFVTTWPGDDDDGRAVLEKYGVGGQKNFQLLMHPNTSRRDADKVSRFLGLPLTWLPATWIFREGKLLHALNYGELRFAVLGQLIEDTDPAKWDR